MITVTSKKNYKPGDEFEVGYSPFNSLPALSVYKILREVTLEDYAENHKEFIEAIGGLEAARIIATKENRKFYEAEL